MNAALSNKNLLLVGLLAFLPARAGAFSWTPTIDNYSITDCEGVAQPDALFTSTGTPTIVVNVTASTIGLRFGPQPHLSGADDLGPIVLHLDFDGDVLDNSPQANPTVNSGVAFTGGVTTDFAQSGDFGGAGDEITINASPTMNSTTFQLTIEVWINPTATGPQPIFEWNDDISIIGPHLWISSPNASAPSDGSLFANLVDTDAVSHTIQSAPGIVQAGVWQHVALTFGSSHGRLYHNGVLVAEQVLGSIPPLQTSVNAHVGRRAASPLAEFVGQMDELRVATRPLSATAISNDDFGGILRISTTGPTGDFSRIEISTLAGAGTYFPSPPSQGTLLTTTVTLAAVPFQAGLNNMMDLSFQDRGGSTARLLLDIGVNITPPSGVSGLTATPLGTTSMRWSWQKPLRLCLLNIVGPIAGQYNLYDAAIPTPPMVGGISVLFQDEGGLPPNGKVERQVTSFDAYGESPKTGVLTAYTWANPPLTPSAVNISTGSMIVTWNGNGNPGYTRYEVRLFTDDTFTTVLSTPVEIVANNTSNTAPLLGLSPQTTHYIGIRAINGEVTDLGVGTIYTTAITTIVPTLPAQPALGALVQGTSSITWSWAAVPGAQFYTLEDSLGPTLTVTGGLSFNETGLNVNEAHGARLRVHNNSGSSLFGGVVTVFTAAAPPTATAVIAVGTATIRIQWSGIANPAGTTYEAHLSSNQYFSGTITPRSTLADNLSFIGLLPATTYYMRVRARNGDSIPTVFDSSVSAVTSVLGGISAAPIPPTVYLPGPGSVAVYHFDESSGTSVPDATGNGNTGTMSCTFVACSSPTFTTGMTGMGTAGQFSGIQNTLCRIPHSASLAGGGDLTVEAWVRPDTGLQTPGAGIVAKGSGTFESFALDVFNNRYRFLVEDSGSNPFSVTSTQAIVAGRFVHVVGVYDSAGPDLKIFIDGVLSSSETFGGFALPRFSDTHELTIGNRQSALADYDQGFQGAIDEVHVLNVALSDVEVSTEYISALPGELTLPAPNDGTTILIPPDTFDQDTTIIAADDPSAGPITVDPQILSDALASMPEGQTLVPGSIIELIANQAGFPFLGIFNSSVTVTLDYPDADNNLLVDGTDPPVPVEQLRMYTLNEVVVRWEQLPSSVDLANHTVTGIAEHFSIFALFGPSGVHPDISAVRVYPIPWRPNSGSKFGSVTFAGKTGLAFDNLSASGIIRIFTLSGERVVTLPYSGINQGTFIWDGRNRGGRKVASGVYFAYVKSDGGSTAILKFAIEQ